MTLNPSISSPRRLRNGDIVEITVEGLTATGLGIAHLRREGRNNDYTVHIHRALPGERVRAAIVSRRGKTFIAQPQEFLVTSPNRCEPRCQHFSPPPDPVPLRCGGCALQMLPYKDQLLLKQRRVEELLRVVGIDLSLVREIKKQTDPWHYRNKMEFTFRSITNGPTVLGLHPTGMSGRVFALNECHLLSQHAATLVRNIAHWANNLGVAAYRHRENTGFLRTLTVREGKRTAERMVVLTTSAAETVPTAHGDQSSAQVAASFALAVMDSAKQHDIPITTIYWSEQVAVRGKPTKFVDHLLEGSPVLREQLHLSDGQQLHFEIHPRAFFQPNSRQAEQLYNEIRYAAGLTASDDKTSDQRPIAFDLYCGTGSIAISLAHHCSKVIGVELDEHAVDNARRNAIFNGIAHASFYAGDVGKVLAKELNPASASILSNEDVEDRNSKADIVVVDPPRSGLMPVALQHIHAIGAPVLVYVSCNPEALARDLVDLARYGFKLEYVQPVDMFPHTAHVECVAALRR